MFDGSAPPFVNASSIASAQLPSSSKAPSTIEAELRAQLPAEMTKLPSGLACTGGTTCRKMSRDARTSGDAEHPPRRSSARTRTRTLCISSRVSLSCVCISSNSARINATESPTGEHSGKMLERSPQARLRFVSRRPMRLRKSTTASSMLCETMEQSAAAGVPGYPMTSGDAGARVVAGSCAGVGLSATEARGLGGFPPVLPVCAATSALDVPAPLVTVGRAGAPPHGGVAGIIPRISMTRLCALSHKASTLPQVETSSHSLSLLW
mmetsp:Transcript_122418/g.346075  ORF Transcript_122418/g.346075 Transcript_122418/m.346075 type:complete len:266 (-) Transcript_122418:1235-2032(-)